MSKNCTVVDTLEKLKVATNNGQGVAIFISEENQDDFKVRLEKLLKKENK
jgi:hypothetical protein